MTKIAPDVFDSIAFRNLIVDAASVANATANVSITNVAPAAVGTATISKWLEVYDNGTAYYIPMWT